MINAYSWGDYQLLVSFTIRGSGNPYGILMEGVSQEAALEHIVTHFSADREITSLSVVQLSEESFEILRPTYEARGAAYYLEGD